MTLLVAVLLVCSDTASDRFTNPTESDVEQLISDLGDRNLRIGAARALVNIGTAAVAPLQNALEGGDLEKKIWVTFTLGRFDGKAEAAAESIVKHCLTSDTPDLRAVAVRSLGRIAGPNRLVVEAIRARLGDQDDRVRTWSALALARLGPAAESAIPELIDALGDQVVRSAAVEALASFGTASVGPLATALTRDEIRFDVIVLLRELDQAAALEAGVGRPTAADLTSLRLAAHDPNRALESRLAALEELAQLGPGGGAILVSLFGDDHSEIRGGAATAFSRLGIEALPLLQRAFADPDPRVRAAAADAVAQGEEMIAELIQCLTDSDRSVRHSAVKALSRLGTAAKKAVPDLLKVVHNTRDREHTRQLAMKALAGTGPASLDVVVAGLEKAKLDSNYGVRSLAAEVLRRIQAEQNASP